MVAAALTRLEHEHKIDPEYYASNTHLFVEGSGEWTGMFHYVKLLDMELADVLREYGLEVEVLWYTDWTLVWRWTGDDWDYTEDFDWTHARTRGVIRPQRPISPPPRRSCSAVLLEGADLTVVRGLVRTPDHASQTTRGVVVVGDTRVLHPKPRIYRRGFWVHRFVDNGEFSCSVWEDENVKVYSWPVNGGGGLEALPDIEGETELKKILARLGIPEDALFPPDTD
jgi:hypothetical protein